MKSKMEIDDSPDVPQKPKFKPNRLCLLVFIVSLALVICLYHYLHSLSTENAHLKSEINKVNILADGALIEISVKNLINKTGPPIRVTRSGRKYEERVTDDNKRLAKLEDIKPSTMNVFFIESRCGLDSEITKYTADNGAVFNARQVCAIESTAIMNPKRPIYILHTCPLDDHFYAKSPKYFQELMSYPNVHLIHLNMSEFFMRTIVERLYFEGHFEESQYPVAHVSDVMRLLVLWKYGGTYMDIDVVSMKPLDDLGINYAGWQDRDSVATGVLNFADYGFGHNFLTKCLEYLAYGYDPHNWSTNGPLLFTKMLRQFSGIYHHDSKSKDFTAYPLAVFYPIYYTDWWMFFDEKYSESTLNQLNQTYIVHIWNKMSSEAVVNVGSSQAYAILADEYCPKAYHNCGPFF